MEDMSTEGVWAARLEDESAVVRRENNGVPGKLNR